MHLKVHQLKELGGGKEEVGVGSDGKANTNAKR